MNFLDGGRVEDSLVSGRLVVFFEGRHGELALWKESVMEVHREGPAGDECTLWGPSLLYSARRSGCWSGGRRTDADQPYLIILPPVPSRSNHSLHVLSVPVYQITPISGTRLRGHLPLLQRFLRIFALKCAKPSAHVHARLSENVVHDSTCQSVFYSI